MIEYDSGAYGGYGVCLYWVGSILPKTVIYGILAGYLTYIGHEHHLSSSMRHPAAFFNGFGSVLGFLLVFRSNLTYQRYWEGRTNVAIFMSKLTDLVVYCKTFVLDVDERTLTWKSDVAQLISLFQAVAMEQLRGHTDMNDLLRQGMMTPNQHKALQFHPEPAFLVRSWLVRLLVQRQMPGGDGVDVSPPMMGRCFVVFSEASLALAHAAKIQNTPFPFPYVQMLTFFLHVFLFTVPFVIGSFIADIRLAVLCSFVTCWAFFAINSISSELEDPFGFDPSDLSLDEYQQTLQDYIHCLELPNLNDRMLVEHMNRMGDVHDDHKTVLKQVLTEHGHTEDDHPRAVAAKTPQLRQIHPKAPQVLEGKHRHMKHETKEEVISSFKMLLSSFYLATDNGGWTEVLGKTNKWAKHRNKYLLRKGMKVMAKEKTTTNATKNGFAQLI